MSRSQADPALGWELRGLGISPDIIVARVDQPMDDDIKRKISMFCTVPEDCVIENRTLPVLYQAPMMLEESHLSDIVCRELSIGAGKGRYDRVAGNARSALPPARTTLRLHWSASTSSCTTHISRLQRRCSTAVTETGCFVDIDWVDSKRSTTPPWTSCSVRLTASSCRAASAHAAWKRHDLCGKLCPHAGYPPTSASASACRSRL